MEEPMIAPYDAELDKKAERRGKKKSGISVLRIQRIH